MRDFTLTALDTVSIQDYIFNSNDLQHIIGASYLVHQATHGWAFQALRQLHLTNLGDADKILDDRRIEDGGLEGELIYSGGGNCVILFADSSLAKAFVRRLSLRLLKEAPDLQLVAAHRDFNWDSASLAEEVQTVLGQVSQRKLDRIHSTPRMGLGVTANCQYTGLPAIGMDARGERRISAEVRAKEKALTDANRRLFKEVPDEYRNGRDFTFQFDDFGEEGQRYVAVVHIDGNNMSQRVRQLAGDPQCRNNRIYIQRMRAFSDSIELAARQALQQTALRLTFLDRENSGKRLLFRPLVFGGDDSTLVCDGRFGISLAHAYLKYLGETPLTDGAPISARAGVAVVKTHFPFARAYLLSEDLAASAREFLKSLPGEAGNRLSAMDWHFASSGPVLRLKEIRAREYTCPEGSLTMRPVLVEPDPPWRTWQQFSQATQTFKEGRNWKDRKNHVLALREQLRLGAEATRQYRKLHKLPDLPGVGENASSLETGWVGKICACFDPIEAMDFYADLEGGAG